MHRRGYSAPNGELCREDFFQISLENTYPLAQKLAIASTWKDFHHILGTIRIQFLEKYASIGTKVGHSKPPAEGTTVPCLPVVQCCNPSHGIMATGEEDLVVRQRWMGKPLFDIFSCWLFVSHRPCLEWLIRLVLRLSRYGIKRLVGCCCPPQTRFPRLVSIYTPLGNSLGSGRIRTTGWQVLEEGIGVFAQGRTLENSLGSGGIRTHDLFIGSAPAPFFLTRPYDYGWMYWKRTPEVYVMQKHKSFPMTQMAELKDWQFMRINAQRKKWTSRRDSYGFRCHCQSLSCNLPVCESRHSNEQAQVWDLHTVEYEISRRDFHNLLRFHSVLDM
jgi:hypothetical protein